MKQTKQYQLVLEAAKRAYCDSNTNFVPNKHCRGRNLHWRAKHRLTVDESVRVMTKALCLDDETQEGYNNFAPSLLRELPADTSVWLAREGSVCIYFVVTDITFTKSFINQIKADEFDFDEKFGGWRVWWD